MALGAQAPTLAQPSAMQVTEVMGGRCFAIEPRAPARRGAGSSQTADGAVKPPSRTDWSPGRGSALTGPGGQAAGFSAHEDVRIGGG